MKYLIQNSNKKKGASIVLTVIILSVILITAFGVSTLMVGEIKISQEVPESLRAYYTAEAGVEASLYNDRKGSGAHDIGTPGKLWDCSEGTQGVICMYHSGDKSCYSVDVKITGPSTDINSYGCYKGVRRAIEVSY